MTLPPMEAIAKERPRTNARRIRRAARADAGVGSDIPPSGQDLVPAPTSSDLAQSEVVETDKPASPSLEFEPIAVALSGKSKRGARTVRRAQKKQQAAENAVDVVEVNPTLGALNRHLNMMIQQLTTAHRVIGRVASERDALRQQLADLQGIPVEEIVVSTIGASSDAPAKVSEPTEPPPKSGLARLNYFGVEDYIVMKKRRQRFALIIFLVIIVLWLASRMGAFQLPENLSRESMSGIPLVGDLVTFFLAGWILFRVVKVSSKGVKWVFPSENQRRRRR